MTRDRVNLTSLLKFEIDLPSIVEQRRIAEIIDALDVNYSAHKELAAKLHRQRVGLCEQLINQESLDCPERQLDNVLTSIDAGWSPLCAEVAPAAGSWGVLKVSAVTSGRYLSSESKTLLPSMRPRSDIEVHNGDLLICRANGVKSLVGVVALVKNTPPHLMMSDKILRLVPDESLAVSPYLELLLKSHSVQTQIARLLSGSSGQNNISQKLIRSLIVRVPSRERQWSAVATVESVDLRIRSLEDEAAKLTSLKRGLVDDLLTGRVRVPVGGG